MKAEARLVRGESGLSPVDDGWFIVNVKDARWEQSERFGQWTAFEGAARFPQLGVNVHVLSPGKPACMYHSEAMQEAFLVLSGECLLLVEEEERRLVQWDFFHCPPGTRHVFVGASEGPCAVLMMGVRAPDEGLDYPASELALKHGAGVQQSTPDPRVAYAGSPPTREISAAWPLSEPS